MATTKQPARGRPRLGVYRLETTIPRAVLDKLIRLEQAGAGYRTRIAANVLCNWAKASKPGGSVHQI
jgi:hypothetical protein